MRWRRIDEKPQHEVTLSAFKIGKYPVTNAQYLRFVEATGREWRWIGQAAGPNAPTSRGDCDLARRARLLRVADAAVAGRGQDRPGRGGAVADRGGMGEGGARDGWAAYIPGATNGMWSKCNSARSDLGDTSPVGMFPSGASPYGCLDMAGNVWEWTTSLWGRWHRKEQKSFGYKYPNDPQDGRENLDADDDISAWCGAGRSTSIETSCAARPATGTTRTSTTRILGFRVVVSPISPASAL